MRAAEVGEVIVETVVEIGGVISVAPVSDGARRKVAILIPYEKLEAWFEALAKKLLTEAGE